MTDKAPRLSVGQVLIGPLFNEPMRVETVQPNGAASWILGLVGLSEPTDITERLYSVSLAARGLPEAPFGSSVGLAPICSMGLHRAALEIGALLNGKRLGRPIRLRALASASDPKAT
jgi:hypothetical protein